MDSGYLGSSISSDAPPSAGVARLETEATFLSLAESQLVLAALASLCAGERDAVEVLRRLLRRVRPGHMPGLAD